MANLTFYTTDFCPYCRNAKALLDARKIDYEEINLAKDPVGRQKLTDLTGNLTFPQIVVGEHVVGGFQELVAADRDGTLAELLN